MTIWYGVRSNKLVSTRHGLNSYSGIDYLKRIGIDKIGISLKNNKIDKLIYQ